MNTLAQLLINGRSIRRQNNIETPQGLLNVFLEYLTCMSSRTWESQHPVLSGDAVGTIVTVSETPPLTYQTFAVFSGITESQLKELPTDNPDMGETVNVITSAIEGHQIEGAALGMFNAGLIQRLQRLAEKEDPDGAAGMVKQIIGMNVI